MVFREEGRLIVSLDVSDRILWHINYLIYNYKNEKQFKHHAMIGLNAYIVDCGIMQLNCSYI